MQWEWYCVVTSGLSAPDFFFFTLPFICELGSVVGIATGLGLDSPRIPVEARFSAPVQTGPGAHPASCTMDTGSFPLVKNGQGVTLTPHPLLVLWSWKGRAIPLLPLWAVQPVQSLSACTRVHFTFMFTFHVIPTSGNVPYLQRFFLFVFRATLCCLWKPPVYVVIVLRILVKYSRFQSVSHSCSEWFLALWNAYIFLATASVV